MVLKRTLLTFVAVLAVLLVPAGAMAEEEKSSSAQMMDSIETILYGDSSKGGLIERLSSA